MAQVPLVAGDVYPSLHVHAHSLTPVSTHEPAAASPHGSQTQLLMSVQVPPVAGDVYPSLHVHAYGRTL